MNAIAENVLFVKAGDNIYNKIKHTVTEAKALYQYEVPVVDTELVATDIENVIPLIGVVGEISRNCKHSDKFKLVLSGGLLTEAFSRQVSVEDIAGGSHDIDMFITVKNFLFINRKAMISTLEEYLTEISQKMASHTEMFALQNICFSAYALTLDVLINGQGQLTQIQFIKKVYNKPYNVISGFDIAPCKILWDFETKTYMVHGDAAYALANRRIKFDNLKYSSSYDYRICKYFNRDFGLEITDEQYFKLENKLEIQKNAGETAYVQFKLGSINVLSKMLTCKCIETCICSNNIRTTLTCYSRNYNNYGSNKFDDWYVIRSITKGNEIRGFTLPMSSTNTSNVFESQFPFSNYGNEKIRSNITSRFIGIQHLKYKQIVSLAKCYGEFINFNDFMTALANTVDSDNPYDITEMVNKIADIAITKIAMRPAKVFDNHTFYIEGEPGYQNQFGALLITDAEWFKGLDELA